MLWYIAMNSNPSMAFKIIKRFLAMIALVQCFTGSGSKLAYHPGAVRLAMRALNGFCFSKQCCMANRLHGVRRRNAIGFNFSFPASLIQSVVQAGDKILVTVTFLNPCSSSIILICMLITSMAGHPLYVGVMITSYFVFRHGKIDIPYNTQINNRQYR